MVKDRKRLEEFEKELIRKTPVNFKQNRKIFEELYKHAVRMKVLPLKNKLDGIETKIKLAKVLNSV